jgi:radical SAM protein with 4Fe4S-binding SPASM domain
VPNVTTNGLLIDERTARDCRVFGNLHLSCHHASELPRLSRAAKALRANRITPGLNVLVSSATYPDLAEILAWARRQRTSQVLFLKFKLTAANRDRRDLLLSEEQERALLPLVGRLSRKHRVMPMLDCSLFPALAIHRPKPRTLEFFDVTGCRGGNAYLAVDSEGRYKPCSFWEETFGDVLSLGPEDWIASPQLRAFRKAPRPGACGGCDYLELCNGGCRLGDARTCQNR